MSEESRVANYQQYDPPLRSDDPRYVQPSPGFCESVAEGFICCRDHGHDGPHAAHGGVDCMIATWEDVVDVVDDDGSGEEKRVAG